jgi:hypothetical protein
MFFIGSAAWWRRCLSWFRQLRSEPAMVKGILAALIFIPAVILQITAPSLDSRQSKLAFALLLASVIVATY